MQIRATQKQVQAAIDTYKGSFWDSLTVFRAHGNGTYTFMVWSDQDNIVPMDGGVDIMEMYRSNETIEIGSTAAFTPEDRLFLSEVAPQGGVRLFGEEMGTSRLTRIKAGGYVDYFTFDTSGIGRRDYVGVFTPENMLVLGGVFGGLLKRVLPNKVEPTVPEGLRDVG